MLTTTEYRSLAIAAAAGPIVSAFIAMSPGPLQQLWTNPFTGAMASSAAAAVMMLSVHMLVERPVAWLHRRYRIHWLYVTLTAFLTVLLLAFFAWIALLWFGRPENGKEAVRWLGQLSGFLSFTILIVSASSAFLKERDTRRDLFAARSKARSLEMQISPHFFFNTLNTISALVPDHPRRAQETIGELADLFRHSMESARQDAIPLARELEFVERYLRIERARFADRLSYTLPALSEAEGLAIPGLTLQPLVENAVRHGIAKRMESGEVQVRLNRIPNGYNITVTNPIDTTERLSPDRFFNEGHALAMVRERLRLLHPNGGDVQVAATADTVEVKVTVLQTKKKQACARYW